MWTLGKGLPAQIHTEKGFPRLCTAVRRVKVNIEKKKKRKREQGQL